MTQTKKGSTVVLPSDFQSVRPLLADTQPLTCENPCGRAHTPAPSPALAGKEAEEELNKHYLDDMPEHVSWRVRDAWLAIPPCSYSEPFCHVDCPYFYECNPSDADYYEEEEWDQD